MLVTLFEQPWFCVIAIAMGFVLLVYGADWLVGGASALAKKFGISDLVIGLTVVALGTSMPEFVVSLLAAMQGSTEIAITNVLGSNAINIFIILGLSAIIYPVASQKQARHFDIPLSLLAGILVLLLATCQGSISVFGGIVLLGCFLVFLYHSFRTAKDYEDVSEYEFVMPLWKALLWIALGLCGLVLGGEAIIRSAISFAHQLGVSDAIIGLTIVALGTSLPELATSCLAAAKHNSDLALGNVIGSNIFNVFFVLGTNALIHPLPTYEGLILDAAMVILGSLLVLIFVFTNHEHKVLRWEGALLVLAYAAYLIYRIVTL